MHVKVDVEPLGRVFELFKGDPRSLLGSRGLSALQRPGPVETRGCRFRILFGRTSVSFPTIPLAFTIASEHSRMRLAKCRQAFRPTIR